MPNLTQQKKDELARWCGGVLREHEAQWNIPKAWVFAAAPFVIVYDDWSPATRPEHGDLVLRALANKVGRMRAISMVWKQMALKAKSWWPEAVYAAALELIEQNKQKGA